MNEVAAKTLERVLIEGDLSQLTTEEKLSYYNRRCADLKLDPLSRPFQYLKLNGKLVLYALKNCAEQLRSLHAISVVEMQKERGEDIYIVTVKLAMPDGRTDVSTGAVPTKGLSGDALANAYMKAETKAKNRGTYSLCSVGMLDETETETIVDAEKAAKEKFPALPGSPRDRLRGMQAALAIEKATAEGGVEPAAMGSSAPVVVEAAGSVGRADRPAGVISEHEHGKLRARIRDYAKARNKDEKEVTANVKKHIAREGFEHLRDITPAIMKELEARLRP